MNPMPYFVDPRKWNDGKARIYIRQNLKPPVIIPAELFIKSDTEFKKGYPKDPVFKNACMELVKKLEAQEKKLGGASALKECWDVMTTKPTLSKPVVDGR